MNAPANSHSRCNGRMGIFCPKKLQMGRWHNLLEILICLDWTYHFALSVRERKGYNATWSIYQLNLYQYEFRVRPTSHCDGRHIGHYSTFFKGFGLAWPSLSESDANLAVFFVDFTYGKYPLVVLFIIPSRAGKLIIIHH